MKQKDFWLRTINVRPDEVWVVKRLFFMQFLQGAGLAFFFTASFALFLDKFEVTELPYVFIYSSFLLWIAGFIYSRIEHKFKISHLAIIITVFIAVSILAFRLAFGFVQSGQFLYFMLAWFNVLYLLNNLEFWGVASLLFDVRQSKRLFSVISAGDIPAKFIGYTLALFAVEYIGTINLLWAGAACILASIPFLVSIKNSGKLPQLQHHHHHQPAHAKHVSHEVGKMVKNFSGNILIRRLAILSIIISTSFIITNYAFYAGVKAHYHNDVALAKFIAFFLAFVRIIALIVKMIFTSRLVNKLGIIKSLLITPIVMLLLISTILLAQDMSGFQKVIIYAFGVTSIVVDILRSAINSPVFLTMMQPLSSHERLRAHTIVKGIMDPFASLITGVLLLLLIHYNQTADLVSIAYILLAISVFWIIGIYRVNNQYLKTIIHTISSRYFNLDNFTINDSGTLEWLKEKIKNGSENEVVNIMTMLYNSRNENADEAVLLALEHPSDKVKLLALQLVRQKERSVPATYLVPLLQNANVAIVAETIKTLCKTGVDNEVILPFIQHGEESVRQAALSGLLNYGNEESKQRVERILTGMIQSPVSNDRVIIAKILGEQQSSPLMDILPELMLDKDKQVRKAAYFAAGKSTDAPLLQQVMNRINTDENQVIEALLMAGESALPPIEAFVNGAKSSRHQKEKLVQLCGRIGGSKAHALLLALLEQQPLISKHVIKALYRSKYTPGPKQQHALISQAKKLLEESAAIIYMQSNLQQYAGKYQLLINSFQLELNGLRESLLYIFAIMYDRENINRVRKAYLTGKKESIINAMEIIDITVRKDLASQFNTIYEPGDIVERMHGLRNIYPVEFFNNVEQLLSRILAEEKRDYHYWTIACSLYTSKKQSHVVDKALVKKYVAAENILLRETAAYAL